MGFHTFDVDRAEKLEDPARFRYCSREELAAALDVDPSARVADLGSGTGFYTRELAPYAGAVEAVDVQAAMHDYFREYGVPENVSLVTAAVGELPFADDALDVLRTLRVLMGCRRSHRLLLNAAAPTMTFHEFATPDALADVRRVLAADARLVVADWSAAGAGEDGPPLDERYDAGDATDLLADAGFSVESAVDRPETLFVVARA